MGGERREVGDSFCDELDGKVHGVWSDACFGGLPVGSNEFLVVLFGRLWRHVKLMSVRADVLLVSGQ